MATRRQEKVSQLIKKTVSDIIANHLNDPRIECFVSVTRVEMAPDLRTASVYLSIFPTGPVQTAPQSDQRKAQSDQNKTFAAIKHAKSRIQSHLAHKLKSKFCPVLNFHIDEQFKKSFETMKLIDQVANEFKNDLD